MQTPLQFGVIILGLFFILVVWQLIHYGKLRPAYALIWMLTAITFLVLMLIPGLVYFLADLFQVVDSSSLILAIGLGFTIFLLLNQSVLISSLSRKNKELTQNFTILQWRFEELESKLAKEKETG